jgi:cellulose synthase/poly-beta-1,6-N-acetylglucosamine synthase-like glycosyltransferase/transposase
MTPKLTKEGRLKLIERVEKGESVAKVCADAGISRVLFYRWYKKYKEEGLEGLDPGEAGRPQVSHTPKKAKEYTILSPHARSLMVKEVTEQNQDASEVAERYNISRVTLYKWIDRYKDYLAKGVEPDMSSKKPYVERYFRQTPENHEQAVLQIVEQHPQWGIRRIVANLPQVAGAPIVGHHGVQNILDRHNLATYELRMAYAQSRVTPVTEGIGGVLDKVTDFFRIPPEKRTTFIKAFTGISLGLFSLIVVFGVMGYISRSFTTVAGASPLGLGFASMALIMGTIFLFYSFKYYFSIAMVLSFSQTQGGTIRKRGIGLTPDLSHVALIKKPYVSVQIPFYNEKYVVERAMEAATNFDYPEYEVILCDDSTDETTQIIANYMKAKSTNIHKKIGDGWELAWAEVREGVTLKHLHRTNRSGYKGGALDLALKLADPRTEYVSIFDADFVPYADTLELFLKYFQVEGNRPEIAAVQGYQWHVLNKSENWITRGVRSEYAGSYVIERSGIEIYGGLKQISGSVYMIKKDALSQIGWGTSITEDFELTLRLYNAGYKVLYTPYIQAPAECVSTLRRLVRQRMRWAEGHSANVRKMFMKLMGSPKLSTAEKFEFAYLSPYYLQAFFFLVGTVCWFLSEAVFKARLPFWTELWGWSLVLTNMISLPLLNAVGMFLEESKERDYLGLVSFVALSYILVPFQAYASVKGLLEDEEGPWFRTPKTGRITDVFKRGKFYRFISGILPGKVEEPVEAPIGGEIVSGEATPGEAHDIEANYYLNLTTANSRFNDFKIKPKGAFFIGKVALCTLLCITTTLLYFGKNVEVVYADDIVGPLKLDIGTDGVAGGTWPAWGNFLNNTATYNTTGTRLPFRRNNANALTNNYVWYTDLLPLGDENTAHIPEGEYFLQIAKSGNSQANNGIYFRVQLLLTNNNGVDRTQILGNMFLIRTNNAQNTLFTYSIGNLTTGSNISYAAQNRLGLRIMYNHNANNARANINWVIDNTTLTSRLVIPGNIQVPEIPRMVVYVILIGLMPAIPYMASKTVERRKKGRRGKDGGGGGWGEWFTDIFDGLTGKSEAALDRLPV